MVERLGWTPELVARFWNALAETRLLELAFSKLAGPHLLLLVRQYLVDGGRHLDFGSGDGDFARLLVDRGVPTACFEPSPARQAAIAARLGGASGFLGCIGPDHDGPPFDVIFMFEVIEHILDDNLADTFRLLDRLLAPNGLLIITTPNNEDLELASAVDPRGEILFHRWQHVRAFNRETLRELIERFGFASIVTHEIEISDRIFADYEGGLGTRPEFANLFTTYRPLIVGNGERLMAITARQNTAAASRDALGQIDEWSRAPVVVLAATALHLADGPAVDTRADEPHAPDHRRIIALDRQMMRHDSGNCWSIDLDQIAEGDCEANPLGSTLELYEDHLPLGPRHTLHQDIRAHGRGRFSHWGTTLFLSASDNSDPTGNNRRYTIIGPPVPAPPPPQQQPQGIGAGLFGRPGRREGK